MMGNYPPTRRIVKSEPGTGTCDTIYTDEFGGRWLAGPAVHIPTGGTTGEQYGIVTPEGIQVRRT